MTERTIKAMAMELAGKFHENKRSEIFRGKEQMCTARVVQKGEDGVDREVKVRVPFLTAYPTSHSYALGHWPIFVEAARACLTGMLGMPDSVVHPNLKDGIYKALLEDNENSQRPSLAPNGGSLFQITRDGDVSLK